MIDENGVPSQLTFDAALAIVTANAAAAGIEILEGSPEQQLANWLAQTLVDADNAEYASIVKQYTPIGTDIDVQNPGFPRLPASKANGFLKIVNNTGGTLSFPANTLFTHPAGNTYTNPTDIVSVLPGDTGFLAIESSTTGASQNLPQDQTFTGGPGGQITNPQPLTGGAAVESDGAYLNRLINARSNNTSQQATKAAEKEFLEFYQDVAIFVNSTNNGLTLPVPVPAQGLNVVLILDSGVNAGKEEIQKAIDIITNRFEFGNLNSFINTLHPIKQGNSYAGVFPQTYAFGVAQAVDSHVDTQLSVSFPAATLEEEKPAIAQAYATAFVQRLINLFSGSAGDFNFSFTSAASDVTTSTPFVLASEAGPKIGPFVSIEAVRALISGADSTGSADGLNLLALPNLTVEFDPNEYEQNPILLSIHAPYEGSLSTVNFILDSLFSDGTSWYDRYIFLDPAKITVSVVEV